MNLTYETTPEKCFGSWRAPYNNSRNKRYLYKEVRISIKMLQGRNARIAIGSHREERVGVSLTCHASWRVRLYRNNESRHDSDFLFARNCILGLFWQGF